MHLVSRYESRMHRMYDRAYTTLRELQNRRNEKIRNEPTEPLTENPLMQIAA